MVRQSILTLEQMIEIRGALDRSEIVRRVINTFIDNESQQRGKGIKFRYPVENLSTGGKLFISRPGGLRGKWNFDFKVEVVEEFGLRKGTHEDIALDFQSKKRGNPQQYDALLQALTAIHNCSENDVDCLLERYPDLQGAFQTGARVDILLKVVKWMFIMEDIVYWSYKGRSMLYNGIMEI